jgi:hypothetical protein
MMWREASRWPDGLFDLQDLCCPEALAEAGAWLPREEQLRMEKDAPTHALAYQYYLWALAQPIGTKEGLRSGLICWFGRWNWIRRLRPRLLRSDIALHARPRRLCRGACAEPDAE